MSSTSAHISLSTGQPEAREAAMKNRIITHMNADHASSLELYLRYFCAVPQRQAANAKLSDITTEHMVIESKAGRNLIKFDPPMNSLTEARAKVVSLHNEALGGLGLSDITIKTFAMPNRVWQMVTCAAVILCLSTFPFRAQLRPSSGSLASQIWSVGGLVPGLANLAFQLSPLVLPFILVVHAIEAGIFARTRLRKHQVPIGSTTWILWLVHAYLGGIACFSRFDKLVRDIEEKKHNSEKH